MINGTFLDHDEHGIYRRRSLKDDEIIGHISSLIGGGIGTQNACLSFVIHMLAMNPAVQQKAFQEIVKVCGYDVSQLYYTCYLGNNNLYDALNVMGKFVLPINCIHTY